MCIRDRYKGIIIPGNNIMPSDVIEHISELKSQGAKIIKGDNIKAMMLLPGMMMPLYRVPAAVAIIPLSLIHIWYSPSATYIFIIDIDTGTFAYITQVDSPLLLGIILR